MQTKLKGFWEKVKGFFAKLNKKTRILLGVCAAVVFVLIVAAALMLNQKEYATLCTGLTANETSSVIQFLNENGVTDYRISNDSILVPKGRENQLQVQLVTSGRLTAGYLYDYYNEHVGSFSTESERREAMRIATQERLGYMLRQFEGVRDATVTISLGEKQVYILEDNSTESTASVIIEPDGARQLSASLVESIRYTVTHSEQRLNISSVSIVDTYGNHYDDTSVGTSAMADATALQREYEQQTNNNVRNQVLDVLEPIYGENNVTVAVNTTVDMSRKVVESTEYSQPEGSVEGGGLIGQERWFWEVGGNGNIQAGGTVGAGPNSDVITYPNIEGDLTGDEDVAAGSGDRVHQIDTTVTQREVLAGTITDVSVAVTINQNAANAGSLSVDQISSHAAVASGIGTDAENWNSHVSVVIAPFDDTVPPGVVDEEDTIIPGVPNWVVLAALGGVLLFLLLLVLILVLRRRSKKKKLAKQLALEAEQREAEEAAAAEAAAAAIIAAAPTGGADIMEVNTEKSMELRKTVRQFAQNNPEIAAQMVKAWLKGEDTSA